MKTPVSLRDTVRFAGLLAALCALTLILALMPGSSARAAGSAAPGRSVGHVFLGMDRADVWKILGKPKRTATVPHGMDLYGEDDWTGSDHTLTVISLRDKVVQVEFDSPRITTTDGLSTEKSTFAQIRRRHPAMTVRVYLLHYFQPEEEPTGDAYYLDDVRGGVAFTCGFEAGVASDALDTTPTSIIIHRLGVAAVPVFNGHWSTASRDPEGLRLLRSWFTPHGGTRK